MLKRLFILLIALISLPVFANTKNELANAIHEFNFDMTVEWDQKDPIYMTERLNRFEKDLSRLKNSNLSETEVREVLAELVKGQSVDVEALIVLNQLHSTHDIINFIKRNQNLMYSRGASWNGEAILILGVSLVLLSAFVVGLSLLVSDYDEYFCAQYSTTETCYIETTDCLDYDSSGWCTSYSPPYQTCYFECVDGYAK